MTIKYQHVFSITLLKFSYAYWIFNEHSHFKKLANLWPSSIKLNVNMVKCLLVWKYLKNLLSNTKGDWWNYSKENLSIVWMTRYSKSKNVFTATLKVLASSHLKSTIKSCPSTFKILLEPPRFGSGSTRNEFQATVACSSDSKGTLRLEKIVTKHYYFLSN